MKTRRRSEPAELSTLVPLVLSELGLEESLRVVRIAERWEEAVGPEIAAHCVPSALAGEVLETEVDSSVWCQQLQLQRPEILAALRRTFGAEAPKDLRFRVGYNRAR